MEKTATPSKLPDSHAGVRDASVAQNEIDKVAAGVPRLVMLIIGDMCCCHMAMSHMTCDQFENLSSGEQCAPGSGSSQGACSRTSLARIMITRSFLSVTKEAGPHACHPWTVEMASYSGWNESRDFWRFCNIPVDAWH